MTRGLNGYIYNGVRPPSETRDQNTVEKEKVNLTLERFFFFQRHLGKKMNYE